VKVGQLKKKKDHDAVNFKASHTVGATKALQNAAGSSNHQEHITKCSLGRRLWAGGSWRVGCCKLIRLNDDVNKKNTENGVSQKIFPKPKMFIS